MRPSRTRVGLSAAALAAVIALPSIGLADDGDSPTADDLERLVDALADTHRAGIGFSPWMTGSQFLPFAETDQMHTGVLGAEPPAVCDELLGLVEAGPVAVPVLLKHLDDDRPTAIEPVKAMMWMAFNDEYDRNRRLVPEAPDGVDRDDTASAPEPYRITVGDLCFVALGQIVNRSWSAVRYQPTGGLVVSSPVRSEALRDAVRAEWGKLDPAAHRASLLADMARPDHDGRRDGAYLRLALYHPDAVEEPVLAALAQPTWDVFAVDRLCKHLYRARSPEKRGEIFDAFVAKHGAGARTGIEVQLYQDLDMADANREGRVHPPMAMKNEPRELLMQLYGQPESVTAADRPFVDGMARTDLARFVEVLVRDSSRKIDAAVLEVFRTLAAKNDDDYLAVRCMKRLAGRGHDGELAAYCHRRVGKGGHEDAALRAQLGRLDDDAR